MLTIHKKKELKKGKTVYYEKVTDGSECQKTVAFENAAPPERMPSHKAVEKVATYCPHFPLYNEVGARLEFSF